VATDGTINKDRPAIDHLTNLSVDKQFFSFNVQLSYATMHYLITIAPVLAGNYRRSPLLVADCH